MTLSLMRARGRPVTKILLTNGPLAGLCAAPSLVLDSMTRSSLAGWCPEIVHEPDYDSALKAAQA